MGVFYDGTKLLSLKDIDGNIPDIYICTSNRSAGKTTYFSRYVVNRFLNHGEKFMLMYRYAYELSNCHGKFFKSINNLFFKGHTMDSEPFEKGSYYELYFDNAPCGYAVALNKAEQVKKLSQYFSDTATMFFDEFQSETNTYTPDEVTKFQSIHKSVARGENEQVRRVPVIMVSNPVTILNPYYISMGITGRLRPDTHFLRGPGWVLEQGYNEAAAEASKASGFEKAFSGSSYGSFSAEGKYLLDNNTFIDRPQGHSKYLLTLRCDGQNFGIREFEDTGIVYADTTFDGSFPVRVSVTTEDHQINYVMLRQYSMILSQLRFYFDHGCFRFRDIRAKNAVLKALSY